MVDLRLFKWHRIALKIRIVGFFGSFWGFWGRFMGFQVVFGVAESEFGIIFWKFNVRHPKNDDVFETCVKKCALTSCHLLYRYSKKLKPLECWFYILMKRDPLSKNDVWTKNCPFWHRNISKKCTKRVFFSVLLIIWKTVYPKNSTTTKSYSQ